MKSLATLQKTPDPKDDFLIVSFDKEGTKQHFQIFMNGFKIITYYMQKGQKFILNWKIRSVVMPDVSGNPTYETQIYLVEQPWHSVLDSPVLE